MLGDTIDIKKDERRYNQLLGEGILPSAAIRKIETEKRLGVGIKDRDEIGDWDIDVVKVAIIGLGLFVGIGIIKNIISPVSKEATLYQSMTLTVDDIPGIDLDALMICRENGLM